MTRQQRRNEQRIDAKIKNKVYTFNEVAQIIKVATTDAKKEYDVNYSICLATALSSPPFNFGKKRVCNVLKLFFDQMKAVDEKVVTAEQLITEAEKVGVFIKNDENKLSVYLDIDGKLFY